MFYAQVHVQLEEWVEDQVTRIEDNKCAPVSLMLPSPVLHRNTRCLARTVTLRKMRAWGGFEAKASSSCHNWSIN